jgi:16S rRNA (guanine527-N7)-methyltransferase
MQDSRLEDQLRSGLDRLRGQAFDRATVDRLLAFLDLLQRWNRSYNLTAIREPGEMVTRHLLDSLAVSPFVSGPRLLDAGTGAGFPGIPLAISRPDLHVGLLDSAGKKVRFLNHVRRELDLENVETFHQRLEEFQPDKPFDEVISRAFTSLAAFATATKQLAPTRLLAMKGRYPREELEALPAGAQVVSVDKLAVPGLQEERHLVIMSINS